MGRTPLQWRVLRFPLPLLLALAVVLSCQAPENAEEVSLEPSSTGTQAIPAQGTLGMVSSAHPLATEVGLEILGRGGNAFDAAVAVAAALNVVEPMMSGMGGYGTILVYSAQEGRARFLNPSGRIPRGVIPDAYRAPTPDYLENRRGAKAVSTPGNVNAWAAMSREYGNLPWAELLEPAARLAEEGFEIDARAAGAIRGAWDAFPDYVRSFYGVDNRPLEAGERLVQADLARSLRLVAEEGPEAFHGGSLGEAVDAAMREADGFLRLEDLKENEAEWWDPIEIDYRGHRVMVPPPPANSFPALVRLGMMSQADVRELGHNSVDFLHLYAEVTKKGFWVRLKYAGDPEVAPPPLDRLLSSAYWEEEVRSIDMAEAVPFVPPSPGGAEGANTTHFVVADAHGNVVSATQTLGNSFGSRIMPEGTGIWLNNSLAYCTFEPAGNPMDAHPGRRKLSGDVPLFVLRDGRPWIAIGTPGGHTIPQTVPQIVMNILDFGMNIQEAISAPRISFVEPDRIQVENGISDDVVAALEARGHTVSRTGALGNAHGLMIEWGPDGKPVGFSGGADPRGAGLAKGRN
jgi:gamma-glutamyltranspeptidase/glutathione hydrolase